jgi:hypothetical protein
MRSCKKKRATRISIEQRGRLGRPGGLRLVLLRGLADRIQGLGPGLARACRNESSSAIRFGKRPLVGTLSETAAAGLGQVPYPMYQTLSHELKRR